MSKALPASVSVLLNGDEIGTLERSKSGLVRFAYRDAWRESGDKSGSPRLPLSLSMPLAARDHAGSVVENFLWGLLPDNEVVLREWGRRFGVSPRNAFALIAHVGEDCAGAVQFVRPDRVAALAQAAPMTVEWLDESMIAKRLRDVRQNPALGRTPSDAGQFSLAGAQPKIALLLMDGRWGIPGGRTPTTHILKPPTGQFDGLAENEHFCRTLANSLGLSTTRSSVLRFGDETAFVAERYDRLLTTALEEAAAAEAAAHAARFGGGEDPAAAANAAVAVARAASFAALAERMPILRLHQEDLCQALAVYPGIKYQNQGGPGPERIATLLYDHSSQPSQDLMMFLNALILNWMIAGTDAHAKNYALLHGGGGRVRLAPLYDLASVLPYDTLDRRRINLAMTVGDRYRLAEISRRDWLRLAAKLRLPCHQVEERVRDLLDRFGSAVAATRDQMADQHLDHPILDRLVTTLMDWHQHCTRAMRVPDTA